MGTLPVVAQRHLAGASAVTDLALVDRLRRLPRDARAAIYAELAATPGALGARAYDWEGLWARPDQIVPRAESWTLMVFAGNRRSGKTTAAIHLWTREILEGRAIAPRIIAANEGDVEALAKTRIVPSLPRHLRPDFISSVKPAGLLIFKNGVEARGYTAAAPESTVSHEGDLDFYDDVAKWGPKGEMAWKHARISCSVGLGRGIVATTRRGVRFLRKLLDGENATVRRPSDPRANKYNLAAGYHDRIAAELGGDDFFAQEMDDIDIEAGSPFDRVNFAALRVASLPRDLKRIAIWIDPATSSKSRSCEVGVVAVGIDSRGTLYGIADRSKVMSAAEWPVAAHDLFDELQARRPDVPNHMGIETNKGGEMGPRLLRAEEIIRRLRAGKPGVSVIEIREYHSKISKTKRAEPVGNLARNGHLAMLPGMQAVESQCYALTDAEDDKNDRADAFVLGVLDLAELDKPKVDREGQTRAAFVGFVEANASFPAPGFDMDRV